MLPPGVRRLLVLALLAAMLLASGGCAETKALTPALDPGLGGASATVTPEPTLTAGETPTHNPPAEPGPGIYPDLRTQPPVDLFLDAGVVDGRTVQVLRFTNRILNAGPGPLEVRGAPTGGPVHQRILQADRSYAERPAGAVVIHPTHDHWHFSSVMSFEVWTLVGYLRWLATGRERGEAGWRNAKLSSCLVDSEFSLELPEAPSAPVYDERCLPQVQGISAGWIDLYPWTLPDQWVVLDPAPLPDGEYVLRSIADPNNLIWESPAGADPEVESVEANEALVLFTVADGSIVRVR